MILGHFTIFWKWEDLSSLPFSEIGLSRSKHLKYTNFPLKNLKTYFGFFDPNQLTRRHRDFLTVFSCAHMPAHARMCAQEGCHRP